MAYDPYSAGQYDYYQDPYQDAGYGYGEYGYENYEDQYYEPSPLPTPDKNWTDPVKVNREYLKKIQKSCIHKGFETLKEYGLFLFEVMVRSISLNKSVFETLVSKEDQEKPFMTFVKILDTPFVEVSETEPGDGNRSSKEFKSGSTLSHKTRSFTNLLQSLYCATGPHDSLIPEDKDEEETEGEEGEERSENETIRTESVSWKIETPIENDEASVEETETVQIMKGKSVLLPMPGFSMIQKMQQYPLIAKVTKCGFTEENEEFEGEILATSLIRLPETFRTAVLKSCNHETVLPLLVVTTGNHKLLDPQGQEVGEAELTLVLTCFGKGAVNCISEVADSLDYAHTYLLRNLKAKHEVAEQSKPPVDPRLAKEIIKLGLFFPSQKTSSEILQHCISSNLIPADDEERKHAQNKKDCGWFHMLKKAYPPPSSHSFDFESFRKEMEMERAARWLKHKKICRDLKTNPPVVRKSLDDRFKEIQTGLAELEVQNPFETTLPDSDRMLSVISFENNTSPHGSSKSV